MTQERFLSIATTLLNVAVAVLLVAIGWLASMIGLFFNGLFVFLLLAVAGRVLLVLWGMWRRGLEYRFWRKSLAPELRGYAAQALNSWIFWLLAGFVLELCIVPAQFDPALYRQMRISIWLSVIALMLLRLLPGRRIFLATNLAFAVGSIFMAVQMIRILQGPSRSQAVALATPFRGEWLVIQGGNSTLINHHFAIASQRHALDLVRLAAGRTSTDARKTLGSHPSWESILYAPAAGTVRKVVNDRPDNALGQTDAEQVAGNYLTIDLGGNRFVLLAHLQKGSILVAPGAQVQAGQPIAKCGNSGNTSEPHLHLQVQDRAEFSDSGVTTFPIAFADITCLRAGQSRCDTPFIVRRNDRLIHDLPEK